MDNESESTLKASKNLSISSFHFMYCFVYTNSKLWCDRIAPYNRVGVFLSITVENTED